MNRRARLLLCSGVLATLTVGFLATYDKGIARLQAGEGGNDAARKADEAVIPAGSPSPRWAVQAASLARGVMRLAGAPQLAWPAGRVEPQ
jgi:hypothetical protein